MYVGELTPVPAYGPRATRDEAGVGASGPRGFRVRFSLVAAQVVAACFTVAYVSVLVRAAVGAIQSALFHNIALDARRLQEILTRAALAVLDS